MDRITWSSDTEKAYVTATRKNGEKRSVMVLPGRKSVSWMENHANKFSKPSELVVDLFSATSVIVQTCLTLSLHLRCAVCKAEAEFFAASTKALVETYTSKVFNGELEISGGYEVVDACQIVI